LNGTPVRITGKLKFGFLSFPHHDFINAFR
jgi:hypothetical protein